MDIAVSVTDYRFLSQSDLIMRHLFSILQIGMTTHSGRSVLVKDTKFRSGTAENPLIVTLKNSQTETVMYVRNIPISAVLGTAGPFERWIAVYPPGDPQNLHFDITSMPKDGCPQILVSIVIEEELSMTSQPSVQSALTPVASERPSIGLGFAPAPRGTFGVGGQSPRDVAATKVDQLRLSVDSLQAELSKARQRVDMLHAGSPSNSSSPVARATFPNGMQPSTNSSLSTAIDSTVREKELQAQQIKERVAEMASAQKRAQDTTRALDDNRRTRDDLRCQIQSLEMQLAEQRAAARILGRDRDQLLAEEAQLLEQIKQRDQTFQDLKASRDEIDRELSRALGEREHQKMAMDTSTNNFSVQSQSMAADIDQSKRQVSQLASALGAREETVKQLEVETLAIKQARASQDAAKREEIRNSLDQTRHRLEEARTGLEEQQRQRQNATSAQQELDTRLAGLERELLELGSAGEGDARTELLAKKDKLEAHAGKLRMLEIQLQEYRDQVSEKSAKMAELHTEAKEKELAVRRCEDSREELQRTMEAGRQGATSAAAAHAAIESQVSRAQRELSDSEASLEALEQALSSVKDRHAKETAEMERDTQNQREKLDTERSQMTELKRVCEDLDSTVSARRAVARERSSALQSARERTSQVSSHLTEASKQVAGSDSVVRQLLQDADGLTTKLDEVRRQIFERRETTNALQAEDARYSTKFAEGLADLERRLASAKEELDAETSTTAAIDNERCQLEKSLAENRSALAEVETQIGGLSTADGQEVQALIGGHASASAELDETRRNLVSLEATTSAGEKDLQNLQDRIDLKSRQLSNLEAEHKRELDNLESEAQTASSQKNESEEVHKDLCNQLEVLRMEFAVATENVASRAQEQAAVSTQLGEAMSEQGKNRAEAEAALNRQTSLVKDAHVHALMATERVDAAKLDMQECEADLATVHAQIDSTRAEVEAEAKNLRDIMSQAEAVSAIEVTAKDTLREVASLEELFGVEANAAKELVPLQARLSQLAQEHHVEQEMHRAAVARRNSDIDDIQIQFQRRKEDIKNKKAIEIDQQVEQVDHLEAERLSLTQQVSRLDIERQTIQESIREREIAQRALQVEALGAKEDSEKVEQILRESRRVLADLDARESATQQEVAEAARQEANLHSQIENLTIALFSAEAEAAAVEEGSGKASEMEDLEKRLVSIRETHEAQKVKMDMLSKELEGLKADEASCQSSCETCDNKLEGLQEALRLARAKLTQVVAEKERNYDEMKQRLQKVRQFVDEQGKQNFKLEDTVDANKATSISSLEESLKQVGEQLEDHLEKVRRRRAQEQELRVEVQRMKELINSTQDKMAHQMEHGNLQFETIHKLEEQKQRFEGEIEVLTLGLHDAEQRNTYLQKENNLMQQQVEGHYQGSLQDWAAEVQRVKVAAEVVKFREEIDLWKSKAERLRWDKQQELAQLEKQHEETIQGLRDRIAQLQRETTRAEQTVKKNEELLAQLVQGEGGQVASSSALLGLAVPQRPPTALHHRRKALLIGSNYVDSHAPLKGCINDVWALQCLLRHTLRYKDDQIRLLLDGADGPQVKPERAATKANIHSGLQWLVGGAQPGDNLLFVFCGYGAQHPRSPRIPDQSEGYLVPSDFAADLPAEFFQTSTIAQQSAGAPSERIGGYRLVSLAEVNEYILRLPAGCRATVVLDSCYSVLPGISHVCNFEPTFPRIDRGRVDYSKLRDFISRPRFLELPVLPISHTPARLLQPRPRTQFPTCQLHCFSACRLQEWCAEFPIEGTVQGAFSWAFLKALARGHYHCGVYQFLRLQAMALMDLKQHFKGVEQTPVLQLSQASSTQDVVLWT